MNSDTVQPRPITIWYMASKPFDPVKQLLDKLLMERFQVKYIHSEDELKHHVKESSLSDGIGNPDIILAGDIEGEGLTPERYAGFLLFTV